MSVCAAGAWCSSSARKAECSRWWSSQMPRWRAASRHCQDLPGQILFQYLDAQRRASERRVGRRQRLRARGDRAGLHGEGFPHVGGHRAGGSARWAGSSPKRRSPHASGRWRGWWPRSPRGWATPPPCAGAATSIPASSTRTWSDTVACGSTRLREARMSADEAVGAGVSTAIVTQLVVGDGQGLHPPTSVASPDQLPAPTQANSQSSTPNHRAEAARNHQLASQSLERALSCGEACCISLY